MRQTVVKVVIAKPNGVVSHVRHTCDCRVRRADWKLCDEVTYGRALERIAIIKQKTCHLVFLRFSAGRADQRRQFAQTGSVCSLVTNVVKRQELQMQIAGRKDTQAYLGYM